MSFSQYSKGGNSGGHYFKVGELNNHSGQIIGPPSLDTNSGLKDDKGNPKSVWRMPVKVDGVDGSWSPGVNASKLLVEAYGENETKWPYPISGRWALALVKTNSGDKPALVFQPNGKYAPGTVGAIFEEAQRQGAEIKAAAAKVPSGDITHPFVCAIDGEAFETATGVGSLSEHVKKEHGKGPAKV